MNDSPLHLEEPISFWGGPNKGQNVISTGSLNGKRIIAIASSDHLKVLNARLKLVNKLYLYQGYPSIKDKDWQTDAVCIDSINGLVAACSNQHVVVWSASGWKVHSTVQVGHEVHAIQLSQGILITAGQTVSVYKQNTVSSVNTWSRIWQYKELANVALIAISPCLTYLAVVCEASNIARIWRLPAREHDPAVLISELWHPDIVRNISWRPHMTEPSNAALFTQTASGVFRIYAAFIDEPDHFALFCTVNHPYTAARPAASFWLDQPCVDAAFGHSAAGKADHIVVLFQDGAVGVVQVSDLSQSPPTCVTQIPIHFHSAMRIAPADVVHLAKRILVHFIHRSNPSFGSTAQPGVTILAFKRTTRTITMIDLPLDLISKPSPSLAAIRHFHGRPSGRILSVSVAPHRDYIVTRSATEVNLWRVRYNATEALSLLPVASVKTSSRKLCVARATVFVLEEGCISVYRQDKGLRRLQKIQHLEIDSSDIQDMIAVTNENNLPHRLFTVSSSGSLNCWLCSSDTESTAYVQLEPAAVDEGYSSFQLPEPAKLMVCTTRPDGTSTIQLLSYYKNTWHTEECQHLPDVNSITIDDDGRIAAFNSVQTLHIWNVQGSEFKSGREFELQLVGSSSSAISWLAVSHESSLLMLRQDTHITIFGKQRRHYLHDEPLWKVSATFESPNTLIDSAWLANGSFVAAVDNDLLLFGGKLANGRTLPELNSDQHRPLQFFQSQFLAQCLFFGHLDLLDSLYDAMASATERRLDTIVWSHFNAVERPHNHKRRSSLFQRPRLPSFDETDQDDRRLRLQGFAQKRLDVHELEHFQHVHQLHVDLRSLSRSIDMDGFRYVMAIRAYMSNLKSKKTQAANKEDRIRYRDMVWAMHSNTQEILLQQSLDSFSGKITWPNARAFGITMWLTSQDAFTNCLETVARNAFTAVEDKDPISSSLFYLALRKRRLVLSLWKQSIGHADRNNMVKFLNNNFDEPRWRTAARKNAFALLAKQRHTFAAAFFILADGLQDAVNICIRQLNDFQLALALARAYEGERGATFHSIVADHVLPFAIKSGFRWLAHWSFWIIDRRDLAVRALLTPFEALAGHLTKPVESIGEPISDDPALAILFLQIRDWSLQTIRGAKRVSTRTEFHFALYMSSILRDLGCHWLALELVKVWQFNHSNKLVTDTAMDSRFSSGEKPADVLRTHRPMLLHRRKNSIKDDYRADVSSAVQSRAASPEPKLPSESLKTAAPAAPQRKAVAAVPEFDMSSFGCVSKKEHLEPSDA